MKKTVSSIIITCMLLMTLCNVCHAATFTSIINVVEAGILGDTITISVSLPANTNAVGGSFNLVYDNTKMQLISATAGDLISSYSPNINKTYATNKIRINFASTSTVPATGGVVLNATFKLIAEGTATISTEKFKLADIDTNYLSCSDASTSITISEAISTVAVTGVSLNKTSASLTVGDTETLTATVLPADATNKNITWTSSDTNIATVSNGKVTAKSAGSAIITVKTEDGNKTATCNVTVKDKIVDVNAPKVFISDIKTLKGKEIAVTVSIENNKGFSNLGLEVDYNNQYFTLTNVVAESGIGGTFTQAPSYTKKPYNFSWNNTNNINYNGKLVTLTFSVNENTPDGVYPVTISYYKGISGNYVDGEDVNYDENDLSLNLTYNNGNITVFSYVPGDINGDGKINEKDGTAILRYLAGWELTNLVEAALDIDGNGKVNEKDGTALLRYLAGWDIELH